MGASPQRVYLSTTHLDPGFSAQRHSHKFLEIIYIVKGSLGLEIEHAASSARAGDVLYYRPSCEHREWVTGAGACDLLIFIMDRAPSAPIAYCTHDHTGRLRLLLQWIGEERDSSYIDKTNTMAALGAAFISQLIKANGWNPEHPLMRLRNHLANNLRDRHTVDQLAAMAGMSKNHLIREYKKLTGRTPMEDLCHLRIDAAAQLLTMTSRPIKQIAHETGFCDTFYFSRVFRKVMNEPPARYRSGARRAP